MNGGRNADVLVLEYRSFKLGLTASVRAGELASPSIADGQAPRSRKILCEINIFEVGSVDLQFFWFDLLALQPNLPYHFVLVEVSLCPHQSSGD